MSMRCLWFATACLCLAACTEPPGSAVTIYTADEIIPMTGEGVTAEAVAVEGGIIQDVGELEVLRARFPGAAIDETFRELTMLPGLIDPHMHVLLGGMLYAHPFAPPWPMATPDGFRLYLVPEFRALQQAFGSDAPQVVRDLVSGVRPAPAPVLPRVKFFADGAFYSQTMRLSPPGYLAGQSRGSLGLWVIPESEIAATVRPYTQAGLSVHIHSNGDAAQTATLDALAELRADGFTGDFVIEHGGLFSPQQVRRAGELQTMVSAARVFSAARSSSA